MKEYESRHDDDDESFWEVIMYYGGVDRLPKRYFYSRPALWMPEEEPMRTTTQLWDAFDDIRPFTRKVAEHYQGMTVRAVCRDSGLQHTYEGVLTPVDDEHSQVGDEIIVNECVLRLEFVKE